MNNIAIIPARSGSKGLPDKNIKELAGKPLLAYTVEAALESGIFDEVMVSTDSEQYAEIAKSYGAEVPFLRSQEHSSDSSSSWDVVREVLSKYKGVGKEFKMLALLQPTSPLRNASDILKAYEFYLKKEAYMVDSVTEMEHSPIWSNTLPEDLSMSQFRNSKYKGMPRQMLPQYYRENGAIYLIDINYFLDADDLFHEKAYAYIMEQYKSIDIDSELDFLIAETIIKTLLR